MKKKEKNINQMATMLLAALNINQSEQTPTCGAKRFRGFRGHPQPAYMDILKKDLGVENSEELARCIVDRVGWRPRWKICLRMTL